MKKVLCLVYTPALQRTLIFDRLKTGGVYRASSATLSAAGKGLNAVRMTQAPGGVPVFSGHL